MVAHGIRFMLGHVARPKKLKERQTGGIFTCLQTPSSVSHSFIDIATIVLQKQYDLERRLRTSASSSSSLDNNSTQVYPLLHPEVLDNLECALFMDVDASQVNPKQPRATIGEVAKLLIQLWDLLLSSCIPWTNATLQETAGFNDQLKRQKAESLIVKLMERREFAKVYEAYISVTEDTQRRWSKAEPPQARPSEAPMRKLTWGSRRNSTFDSDALYAFEALSLAKDPTRLLEKYMALVNRTVAYAGDLVQHNRPFFIDVLSILYCRLPSVQKIVLDVFDKHGFNGTQSYLQKKASKTASARRKSFFQEDNSAFYGWDLSNSEACCLDAIDNLIHTAIELLMESRSRSTIQDPDSDIWMQENDDEPDDEFHAINGSSRVDTSFCLELFLSLWTATTEHIQRTSRGHIPWTEVPPFVEFNSRAQLVFEKCFAYQTFDCDEDTNGLRFRLIAERKEKLDRRLPFDVKHPRVVFSTIESILLLTKLSYAPYLKIMFKETDCYYVRSAIPCLSLLEQWINNGTAKEQTFDDDATYSLLVKYIEKLLNSDRMDRLKAIQVFLLHCIGLFSIRLQKKVLKMLVSAFSTLFNHWSRDVRFCYHLLLIYIFGDRRQLNSRSDAILLGFLEVPTVECLVEFQPFDFLLLQTLRACKDNKPTMAYARASFTEYINQLEMMTLRSNVAMNELEYLPQLSPVVQMLCVLLYVGVGLIAFKRSFQMRPRLLTRQKVFQYLVTTFCCMRALSLLITRSAIRDVLNRTALCLFFSLIVFQVFFWFDVVNPSSSARSKRVWHSFLWMNVGLYAIVIALEFDAFLSSSDGAKDAAVNYWSDLLPVLLVVLGSLLCCIGLLFSICKMRMRVQRLMNELDRSLSQRATAKIHHALCYLNCIFLVSSMLFLLRAFFYLQHPSEHRECGSIQDPNICLGVGYVVPELIPCVFFVIVMWDVDPNLWRSNMSTGETTPLLGKNLTYTPGFGNDLRWHRPSPIVLSSTPTLEPPYLRVNSVSPRQHPVPINPSTSMTPPGLLDALWLSFQCFQLKYGGSEVHASLVIVHMLQDGIDDIELGRSEIAHTTDPEYHIMVKVPLESRHLLRLRIYAIRNLNTLNDLTSQSLVGETMLRPLELGQSQLYRLSGTYHGEYVSNTGFVAVRCEANAIMDTAACITRGFIMLSSKVLVEEELVESPYTYEIPYQMLQLIQADLVQKANWMAQVLQTNRRPILRMSSQDELIDSPVSSTSLLTEMIYQLQGNARKRTNRKWRGGMLRDMEAYIAVVDAALNAYGHPDRFQLSFKPSTKKADAELRFVALNLHLQLLTMGEAVQSPPTSIDEESEGSWDDNVKVRSQSTLDNIFHNHHLIGTTTVGAFAAHVYGFGQGGIRQLREDLERLRERSLKATDWSDNTTQGLQRDMYQLEWHIDQRLDVAFIQAISALVPTFQQTLYTVFHTSTNDIDAQAYLRQIVAHGFLIHVESLLSTVGSEAGMLGDMDAAVKALAYVQIGLRCVPDAASAAYSVAISSGPQGLVIELPLIMSDNYTLAPSTHRIPGQDKASGAVYCPFEVPSQYMMIKIVPVLFTQGMNELQTVANTVRKGQLQHAINQESAVILESYLKSVNAPPSTFKIWDQVKKMIYDTRDEKCMDILEKTSYISRSVGAGRVTCCKSAKDRTAMSVTLEQSKFMISNCGDGDVAMWTQLLRTYGVRRENARKNIGSAQYCFSSWQNYLLPSAYKCPPGTGGGSRAHS